jgi:hypothetical protein
MEVENGDYSSVLFKILWQGTLYILNLLFNEILSYKACANKQGTLFPHKVMIYGTWDSLHCCLCFTFYCFYSVIMYI